MPRDLERSPRAGPAVEIIAGVLVGLAGALWIAFTWTHPLRFRRLAYHVPLAIITAAACVAVARDWRQRPRPGFAAATVLAGILIAARMKLDWPCSGHGILGALIASTRNRLLWRMGGILIIAQAWIMKPWLDEDAADAFVGAAAGLALGGISVWLDRQLDGRWRPNTRTSNQTSPNTSVE